MTILRGTILTPDGVSSGWLRVAGQTIVDLGEGEPPRPVTEALAPALLILPGLVDLHCHGGAGHAFSEGAEQARAAAHHHHRSGTTTLIASLVSDARERLRAQVEMLGGLSAAGVIDGLHLEGPFLAHDFRGAHSPMHLRAPDLTEMRHLMHLAGPHLRAVTLAPELPRAVELIGALVGSGVRACVGHTGATAEETSAALDAGATIATHLFNGMAPFHHRRPGPVPVLLMDPRVRCELIADGHHLSEQTLRFAWQQLDPPRRLLVSDASPACGGGSGVVRLGDEDLTVADGRVTTADGESLAGSTITLLDAVRHLCGIGLPLHDVVHAASAAPAAAAGLDDRGRLAAGARADLLVVDQALRPVRVMRAGTWL